MLDQDINTRLFTQETSLHFLYVLWRKSNTTTISLRCSVMLEKMSKNEIRFKM